MRGKLNPEKVNFKTVFCKKIKKNIGISFDIYNIKQNEEEQNEEEQNYLNLIKEVIKQERRETRNGATYSMFGGQLKFDLENGFPLLTTKKNIFTWYNRRVIIFYKRRYKFKKTI